MNSSAGSISWRKICVIGAITIISILGMLILTKSVFAQTDDIDNDGYGFTDAWELELATAFMPIFEFDEDEHNPITGADGIQWGRDVLFYYQVSPVDCFVNGDQGVVLPRSDMPTGLMTIVGLYSYDYVPYDTVFTSEDDVFAHYGDTERVRLCLEAGPSGVYVTFMTITRHSHQHFYRADEITYVGTHPYLYVSEGKHATYVSKSECEDAVSGFEWLAWDEDCGEGAVIRPEVRADMNVGEYIPGMRVMFTNAALFPNEAIWTNNTSEAHRDNHFCGGYNVPDYNSDHSVISPGYDSPWCAGGLPSKWWDGNDYD